ncbi:MAG: outer membrane beta-barrel protein [Sphingomicrobium sp.]
MRKYLLAGAAALVIAVPAAARDNTGYIGVEGGVLFPKSQSVNATVDFTDALVTDIGDTRVASFKSKTGYDIDAIAGYDFGMFRLEGELGYKRAKLKSGSLNSAFLTSLNLGSGTIFTGDEIDFNNKTSVLSGMINGLVDFGPDDGINGFVGAGVGRAKVKQFSDSDSAWAYQLLAGVRAPVSQNIDVGLKYRYFRTGKLNFNDEFGFTGTGLGSGGTVFFDNSSKFSSHSLLASLIFNLGSAEVAPAPMAPMAPAPEPMAPQTQTCPDGSVILATSMCAAPPPPPPPPAAPVERGERGQ